MWWCGERESGRREGKREEEREREKEKEKEKERERERERAAGSLFLSHRCAPFNSSLTAHLGDNVLSSFPSTPTTVRATTSAPTPQACPAELLVRLPIDILVMGTRAARIPEAGVLRSVATSRGFVRLHRGALVQRHEQERAHLHELHGELAHERRRRLFHGELQVNLLDRVQLLREGLGLVRDEWIEVMFVVVVVIVVVSASCVCRRVYPNHVYIIGTWALGEERRER